MLQVSRLTKQFGKKVLFEDVSLNFSPGMRVGVVGANGCGKSTFLRMISRDESIDSGNVSYPKSFQLGVLRQDHFAFEKERILDVVLRGNTELWNLVEKRNALFTVEFTDQVGHDLAEVEHLLAERGFYRAEGDAGAILEGLGIPTRLHEEPLSILSGGFKLRVLLAQVLFSNPDILLLDEPTNHLDIVSIQWLEQFLAQYPGVVLIVSHDRYFLDRTCTHIADVDYKTITLYTGNYTGFLVEKENRRELLEKSKVQQEKKIEQLQTFVDRFGSKISLASRAQSKLKQIEKMEEIEIPDTSRRAPGFRFEQLRPSGQFPLQIKNISHSYGEKQVLKNVGFSVPRGNRIGLIGPNGVGKSTLLKIIIGDVTPTEGLCDWGYEASIGYFQQDIHQEFKKDTTVYEWLYSFKPDALIQEIRGLLGQSLFSGDEVHKSVLSLSGGEAARLVLAKIMLLKPNFLILDEPTNHLDLESIEALANALTQYKGTVLFVSHDRSFVSKVATRIVDLSFDRFLDFPGDYAEFLHKEGQDYLSRTAAAKNKKKPEALSPQKEKNKDSYQESKQRSKDKSANEKKLSKVEQDIAQVEKEIGEIEGKLSAWNSGSGTKMEDLTSLTYRHEELKTRLNGLYEDWDSLQA